MIVIEVALGAMAVAFVLTLYRMWRGPTTADRALAGDLGYLLVVASLALLAGRTGAEVLVDLVLVATLLGFLALLAFAWYVMWRRS